MKILLLLKYKVFFLVFKNILIFSETINKKYKFDLKDCEERAMVWLQHASDRLKRKKN